MGGGGRGEEDLGKVLDLGLVPRYLWRVRPECSYSQECLRREDLFFLQADEIVVLEVIYFPCQVAKVGIMDTDYHSGSDLDIILFLTERSSSRLGRTVEARYCTGIEPMKSLSLCSHLFPFCIFISLRGHFLFTSWIQHP